MANDSNFHVGSKIVTIYTASPDQFLKSVNFRIVILFPLGAGTIHWACKFIFCFLNYASELRLWLGSPSGQWEGSNLKIAYLKFYLVDKFRKKKIKLEVGTETRFIPNIVSLKKSKTINQKNKSQNFSTQKEHVMTHFNHMVNRTLVRAHHLKSPHMTPNTWL